MEISILKNNRDRQYPSEREREVKILFVDLNDRVESALRNFGRQNINFASIFLIMETERETFMRAVIKSHRFRSRQREDRKSQCVIRLLRFSFVLSNIAVR